MAKRAPIFKKAGRTYQADACEPLVRAAETGKVHLEALARGSYPGRRLPGSALPQLSSIGFWDAQGQQDWGLDWHCNEGIELTFLETGSLPFAVENREHQLQPNDLTITRPWQPHCVGRPHVRAGRLHWVILDLSVRRPNQSWKWPAWIVLTRNDLQQLTTLLRHNEQSVWRGTREIRRCFQQIATAIETNEKGSNVSRLAAYLNELFVLVLQMLHRQRIVLNPSLSSTRRTVELFLTDLERNGEHLRHPWTLVDMAQQCGLGVTHFVHHCRQITNMTPIQYLNHCRVETACRMLGETPEMKVIDVALACGFESSQYFATVFRRHRLCSPSAFRTAATG